MFVIFLVLFLNENLVCASKSVRRIPGVFNLLRGGRYYGAPHVVYGNLNQANLNEEGIRFGAREFLENLKERNEMEQLTRENQIKEERKRVNLKQGYENNPEFRKTFFKSLMNGFVPNYRFASIKEQKEQEKEEQIDLSEIDDRLKYKTEEIIHDINGNKIEIFNIGGLKDWKIFEKRYPKIANTIFNSNGKDLGFDSWGNVIVSTLQLSIDPSLIEGQTNYNDEFEKISSFFIMNNELVGAAKFSDVSFFITDSEKLDYKYLNLLEIKPKYRNNKIGNIFLSDFLNKYRKCRLHSDTNLNFSFYKKLGFRLLNESRGDFIYVKDDEFELIKKSGEYNKNGDFGENFFKIKQITNKHFRVPQDYKFENDKRNETDDFEEEKNDQDENKNSYEKIKNDYTFKSKLGVAAGAFGVPLGLLLNKKNNEEAKKEDLNLKWIGDENVPSILTL